MLVKRKYEVNLEWPLLLLAGLIAWRYGGYVTAQVVAWGMVAILLVGFALLSLVTSTNPYHSSVQIGGVKVESRVSPLPSRRTLLTLGAGALAFVYLAWHGHPWALVGAVALLLELLPGTPSLWDEYVADVLRRALVQAGFAGMLAAVLGAVFGVSALEVAVLALSGYLLTLQLYLYRWQKAQGAEGEVSGA